MKALLDDLVDFNRIMLGLGINVALADIDLAAVFADELEQLRGAHPGRQIKLEVAGDTQGRWDGPRLQQLLRNLVANAIKYGAPDAPVRVVLTGDKADVRIEVANSGPTIERSTLDQIFDPLKRGPAHGKSGNTDDGLGLGLYIVREVTGRTGARSMCVPTREKPCSLYGCLGTTRVRPPEGLATGRNRRPDPPLQQTGAHVRLFEIRSSWARMFLLR